jgi:hypothetical protein
MKFILLLLISIFLFTGCEAVLIGIHEEAAYGDINRDCKTMYGQRSFYHSSWNGCVVPGMDEQTCEANGGKLRSLMSRCIIPIR